MHVFSEVFNNLAFSVAHFALNFMAWGTFILFDKLPLDDFNVRSIITIIDSVRRYVQFLTFHFHCRLQRFLPGPRRVPFVERQLRSHSDQLQDHYLCDGITRAQQINQQGLERA